MGWGEGGMGGGEVYRVMELGVFSFSERRLFSEGGVLLLD
jgi:hypothetical protein